MPIHKYGGREWSLARMLAPHSSEVFKTLNLKKYGITPNAILAGILEETHDRHETIVSVVGQRLGDKIASNADETSLNSSHRTTGRFDKKFTNIDKLNYPTTIDVGVGNLQINKALRLIESYSAEYPQSDPLKLKQYKKNIKGLVSALNDRKDFRVTVAIAGLVVKETADWLKINTGNWDKLSQQQKEGLISYGYNVGIARLEKNKRRAENKGVIYNPDVNNTDIAQEYILNSKEIERSFKEGIGEKVFIPDEKDPLVKPNHGAALERDDKDGPLLSPSQKKQSPTPHNYKAVRVGFSNRPFVEEKALSPFIRQGYETKATPNTATPQAVTLIAQNSNPLHENIIEKLEGPTPELIENNPFAADEYGNTNLTEEAYIWKKNKNLAGKLIELAGRQKEFSKFFPEDEND